MSFILELGVRTVQTGKRTDGRGGHRRAGQIMWPIVQFSSCDWLHVVWGRRIHTAVWSHVRIK